MRLAACMAGEAVDREMCYRERLAAIEALKPRIKSMIDEVQMGHEWDCPSQPLLRDLLALLTDPAVAPPTEQTVRVVVNGQPVSVQTGSVPEVIQRAIEAAHQIGAPIAQWELRTREGDIIPHDIPEDYFLSAGKLFFLNLGLPAPKFGGVEGVPQGGQGESHTPLAPSDSADLLSPVSPDCAADSLRDYLGELRSEEIMLVREQERIADRLIEVQARLRGMEVL